MGSVVDRGGPAASGRGILKQAYLAAKSGLENVYERVLALLALSMILAMGSTSAQAAKPNKPAKADRQAKKDQKGVVGTVIKVDGMNIVVKTRGKQGGEVTVTTDASTKFTMGKNKEGTIADVKEGENVVVSPATGTAESADSAGQGRQSQGRKPAKNA